MAEPGDYVLRFGEYQLRKLADVGSTEKGLVYLFGLTQWKHIHSETRNAINAYFRVPEVYGRLKVAMGRAGKLPKVKPKNEDYAQQYRNLERGY